LFKQYFKIIKNYNNLYFYFIILLYTFTLYLRYKILVRMHFQSLFIKIFSLQLIKIVSSRKKLLYLLARRHRKHYGALCVLQHLLYFFLIKFLNLFCYQRIIFAGGLITTGLRYKFQERGDEFTSAAKSSASLFRQQCAIEMPSPSYSSATAGPRGENYPLH